VDPVTGFSRRSLLALGVVVSLGVVASTVATVIEARGDAACPDPAYGCAAFEPAEPVRIGVLFPAEEPGRFGAVAAFLSRQTLRGHPVQVASFDGRCSTEAATEAARELATDPPDGPPVVAVVGDLCDEAEIPVVQILDDSGITFVTALDPGAPAPVRLDRYLLAPMAPPGGVHLDTPRPLGEAELAAIAATRAILEVADEVAVDREGTLLIPRTPLRDGLVAEGLEPVQSGPRAPGSSNR
jgi:hypothetical protein